MDFEWDSDKSNSNREKHGIDFDQATEIWRDPKSIEVPARTQGEPRFAIIGVIAGKIWTAIFTKRESKTRIISVRRSRDGEEAGYNKQ